MLRFPYQAELLTGVAPPTLPAGAAVIAFSPASIRYPILGRGGCLHFLDVAFYGLDLIVTLQTNSSYPGTVA